MDWLTFAASIINSVAWPIVIIIVVLLFRSNILDILPSLSKLKYKGIEVEFRKELYKLKEKVVEDELLYNNYVMSLELERKRNHLAQIALISARAAIVESWEQLGLVLADMSYKDGHITACERASRETFSPTGALEIYFGKKYSELVNKLSSLYLNAIDSREGAISSGDAIEYVNLVMRFLVELKGRMSNEHPEKDAR